MSVIQCPFCQSLNIQQFESKNTQSHYFEQLQERISPVQMALCGMRFAKKLGLSLKTGAVIGVVVGGVLIVVSQLYYEKYYNQDRIYKCLNCNKNFAFSKTN